MPNQYDEHQIIDEKRGRFCMIDIATIQQIGAELDANCLAVYTALHVFANFSTHDGAFASYTTIGKTAGSSRSTAARCLERLAAAGFISATPRKGPHGQFTSKIYTILSTRGVTTHAPDSTPTVTHTESRTVTHTESRPRDHVELEQKTPLPPKGGPPKGGEYSVDFETFWRSYPRKIEKVAAWNRWKRMNGTRPPVEDLVASIEAHKQSPGWRKDNGEFIPYPATWLNKGGWTDELAANGRAAGPSERDLLLMQQNRLLDQTSWTDAQRRVYQQNPAQLERDTRALAALIQDQRP